MILAMMVHDKFKALQKVTLHCLCFATKTKIRLPDVFIYSNWLGIKIRNEKRLKYSLIPSNPVLLLSFLMYCFLEISIKAQNLYFTTSN